MRTAGLGGALLFLALALGAGVGAELRARQFQAEAAWLLERAQAQADEYVQTFRGEAAEAQLATFKERRAALSRAHRWEQGRSLAVLLTGAALVVAYGLFLRGRLEASRLYLEGEREAARETSMPAFEALRST